MGFQKLRVSIDCCYWISWMSNVNVQDSINNFHFRFQKLSVEYWLLCIEYYECSNGPSWFTTWNYEAMRTQRNTRRKISCTLESLGQHVKKECVVFLEWMNVPFGHWYGTKNSPFTIGNSPLTMLKLFSLSSRLHPNGSLAS